MDHALLDGEPGPPVLEETRPVGFRHWMLPYDGIEEFVAATGDFLREGLALGERALVILPASRIDALRRELGPDADRIEFQDMAGIGLNPARIIPAWQDFLELNADPGRGLRCIGETIYAERGAAEVAEGQLHEALLDAAFAHAPELTLLCPYDTSALPAPVIEEAFRSHHAVHAHGLDSPSWTYLAGDAHGRLAGALPVPPTPWSSLSFASYEDLAAVRALVTSAAASFGLDDARAQALVLVVHETTTNSIMHGAGTGTVSCWHEKDALVVEVEDAGRFPLAEQPLVGRVRPGGDQERGRGLWLVNQLADLVQVRTGEPGTTVRVSMRR